MCRKLYFVVAAVLVLVLGGWVHAVEEVYLNVENHSFELDENGDIACGHGPIGIGWESRNNWVGVDVNCAAGYTPGYPEEYYCMDCDPCDPQSQGGECNCKVFPASDGHMMCYMQSNDTELYQLIDDAIILANHQYRLIMDVYSYSEAIAFTASIYYPDGDNEIDVASKFLWPGNTIDDPDSWFGWKESSVILVVPPGHPAIGSQLGIKWVCPDLGDNNLWPFIDNIRITDKLATDAWKPSPEDEAINVPLDTTKLIWSPGLWADTHNVYFGTNWADVSSRDPNTIVAMGLDVNEVNIPVPLQLGGEYFWVVDEVNEAYIQIDPCDANYPDEGPWPGIIWRFKTNDGKAFDFTPANNANNQPTTVQMSWTPGQAAAYHNVYFSTNWADVNSRAEDANQGYLVVGANTFDPTPTGELALGETYFWAVDEVNTAMLGSPWKSDVLRFTTIDHVPVEDFDSYLTTGDLWDVWNDYYVNGSGAGVFIEKDVNLVEGGSSMMFTYDNQNALYGYYSEAYADITDLGIDSDWTYNNVQALRLAFRGDADNALDQMYVALTDGSNHTGKVLYDGDPNDLQRYWLGFQEWNIDLDDFVAANSVDLSNISRLTIGFGDKSPGGTGTVWFDNIRLHPPRCIPSKALNQGSFDSDDDCLVDYYDLDVLANRDWLLTAIGSVTAAAPNSAPTSLVGHWPMEDDDQQLQVDDVSGNNNHGLLYDDDKTPGSKTALHSIDDGAIGKALTFDGVDDYIEIQPLNLNTNEMTISAWVRREGSPNIYSGIVFTSDPCSDPNTTAGIMIGADTVTWEANNELAYMWTGTAWEWRTGLFLPDYWSFVALTIAPDVATVYLDDGLGLKAARNYVTHDVKPWAGRVRIGDQMQWPNRIFRGAIDDVRIYNYTLTPEEILYLALQGAGSTYLELPAWRADITNDDEVNFKDFAIMADNWLQEAFWP